MYIIEGEPLSIDTTVTGVYRKYNPRLEKGKYIIGIEEQHPEVLLLEPKAILTKYGGYLSHLAIVSREKGIPLYRVSNLDQIVDNSLIMVVPKYIKVEVPEEFTFRIRFTKKYGIDSLLNTAEHVRNFYELDVQIRSLYCQGEWCYAIITLPKFKEVIERISNNPLKYIEPIIIDITSKNYTSALFIRPISEFLFKMLMDKYGIDRIRRALPPYESIWSRVRQEYFQVRFGIKDKEIIKAIRRATKSNNREFEPLEDRKDRQLLEFVYLSIILYESKNLQ